jgi:hypothetical protein
LGLRILPPGPETQELRNEIEGLLQLAISQAASGKVQPKLVVRIRRDINQLGRLLNQHADALPVSPYTIAEAKRFLTLLRELAESL